MIDRSPFINFVSGMDGVDKEKVQRVVYKMSKGSKYFENEERKEAFIRQKIDNMRVRSAKLSAADISHYQTVNHFIEVCLISCKSYCCHLIMV